MTFVNRRQRKTFDLGTTLVDVDAELARTNDMVVITFYVNGTSLRSHNMELPSVMMRTVEAMWVLAGNEEIPDTTEAICAWITEAVAAVVDHKANKQNTRQ